MSKKFFKPSPIAHDTHVTASNTARGGTANSRQLEGGGPIIKKGRKLLRGGARPHSTKITNNKRDGGLNSHSRDRDRDHGTGGGGNSGGGGGSGGGDGKKVTWVHGAFRSVSPSKSRSATTSILRVCLQLNIIQKQFLLNNYFHQLFLLGRERKKCGILFFLHQGGAREYC